MTDTKVLRDKLLEKLVVLVDEELSPSMVSAMTNFLKTFPPHEDMEDLPTAKKISESLKKYQNVMPFDQGSA
tara:strand:+ start:2772 stop:2987 length:216 start_codon:yes stop_codon:yes gene_type:complete